MGTDEEAGNFAGHCLFTHVATGRIPLRQHFIWPSLLFDLFLLASQGSVTVPPSFAGRHIDQNKLGVSIGCQTQGLLRIDSGLVGLVQRQTIYRQFTLGKI